MTASDLQQWMVDHPILPLGGVSILSLITFMVARGILARGLIYITSRTKTKYDDIIVKNLRPFRIAWLAALTILYSFAYLFPDYQTYFEKVCLFLILWVAVVTISALITAVNDLYESGSSFTGVSVQGY